MRLPILSLFVPFAFLISQALTAQTGCIKGDCANGFGVFIFENNARYEGEFADGLLHGRGILLYPDSGKYIGHWEYQQRSGRGRMKLPDGSEYLGDFLHNNYHGQGVMTYANGNRYTGEWADGQPQGDGQMTFADGSRYEGAFFQGAFDGPGVRFYADGSRYEGEWHASLRQGMGAMYYPNGEVISGQWQHDQFLANWNQLAFQGDTTALRNCGLMPCLSGKGKFTYPNGMRYIGDFNQGQPEGLASVYFPDGARYDGGWQFHQPHGRGVMYYPNGRILGAIWQAGQPLHQLFVSEADERRSPVAVDQNPAVKIWAVIVGAARYTAMPALRYSDDDAYQVFAFLKSPEGGALPDHQIRLLIDEDATRDNILAAMRATILRADDNDVVLFYFSGHGLPGAFLPIDYDGYDFRLEHEEITQILRSSRAKHKIVLADACHSGTLLAARTTTNIELQRYYQAFEQSLGGTALLLSSKAEEYSLEDRGLRSGIFSHYLIRGLKGEADANTDRIVNISELYNYIYQQVRRYTGNVQTPTLTGSFDGAMPVAFVRY